LNFRLPGPLEVDGDGSAETAAGHVFLMS